ncbi:MAG: metal-dependent hydrolase [Candidatus ainarchaeum sp.]|nr:metal-dependent hydrolase [Candidatus ainarchaeum sp.]
MNWKGHFLFAFILFLLIGYFILNIEIINLLLFAILAGFSSVLPDMDHELSKFRKISDKLFPIITFVYLFWNSWDLLSSIILTLLFSGVYFLIFTFLKPKHRGITHSLFALITFSIIIYIFAKTFFYPFFIGYLSHLLADRTFKLL